MQIVHMMNCCWWIVPYDWPSHRKSSVTKFCPCCYCPSPRIQFMLSHCCSEAVENWLQQVTMFHLWFCLYAVCHYWLSTL